MAGLGRGLGSLLSESKKGIEARALKREAQAQAENADNPVKDSDNGSSQILQADAKNVISMISIDLLVPSVYQPRKSFDEESIGELANSIREHGVLEPLLVKKIDDRYNIICGERRYRASQVAGITELPCLVRDDLETDTYAIALIDNIQREDLNPIEMAQAFSSMIEECSLTQEELAKTLGKSRSSIANILRLNNLQEDVKKMVVANQIDLGHAKVLLSLEEPDFQLKAALYVIKNSLNVRQTEELVKDIKENGMSEEKAETAKKPKFEASAFDAWKKAISNRFDGLKVKFSAVDENRGKVTLAYTSKEQLDRLMALLSDESGNSSSDEEISEVSASDLNEEACMPESSEEMISEQPETAADNASEDTDVRETSAENDAEDEAAQETSEDTADDAGEIASEGTDYISSKEALAEEGSVEEIPSEQMQETSENTADNAGEIASEDAGNIASEEALAEEGNAEDMPSEQMKETSEEISADADSVPADTAEDETAAADLPEEAVSDGDDISVETEADAAADLPPELMETQEAADISEITES